MAVRAAGFPIDDLLRLGNPGLAAGADAGAEDGPFRADYQAAIEESGEILAEIIDTQPFRAAMVWQNRELVGEVLETYLAARKAGRARNKRQRHRERLLTRYVQRYHAKNESIGFFGPVGWAHWAAGSASAPSGTVLALSATGFHGDIAARRAQLEAWAVRLLAERFSADPQTRPWLRPVTGPAIKVREGKVYLPLRGWTTMPRPRFDVLAACDGRRTVTEISDRLIASDTPGIASIADVERHLANLERAGHVAVGLRVPLSPDADRYLREQLSRLPDAAARDRQLTVLDGIREAADGVRQAAADYGQLTAAFADLEARFTEATGLGAYRSPGANGVVGRALVVEDCRSALSATFQPSLLADLAGPLDLVLASARWLVDRVGSRYLEIAGEIYDGMARPGSRGVGLGAILTEFVPRCRLDVVAAEAAASVAEFQRHWTEILRLPPDAARHHVRVASIADGVRERFAAASAPWLSGRIHCPDIMIAAADMESVSRGDYTWVLGELHPAANTLNQSTFVLSHPDPERIQAMADDTASGGPWLIPVYPSGWPGISGRSYPPPYLISPELEYLRLSAEPPREGMTGAVVPVSDLTVVRDDDGTLWLEDDDGRRRHPLALLGEFLVDGLPELYQPIAPLPHRPRVSIDRFVLAREQWRIMADELSWPAMTDEAGRYRAARQWARGLGLPRHVFIRAPGQPKPYYADLTSPFLVNMIAKVLSAAARQEAASAVTITEMFPGPGELWLPHRASGGRCTSELRLAIVDRGH